MGGLISLVVPTYQRRASIERLLNAVDHQTLPPESFEVIVSIDGSQDGTRELVESYPAEYRLRSAWQPNQGRSKARNAGIHLAQGDVVVLLDDDMEPAPAFLEAHCLAHPSGCRQAVIGPVPIRVDSTSAPVVKYIGQKFNAHLEKVSQPGYQLQVRDFYGGNFSIRKDLLLQVGLFDETFTTYGNEDLELFVRLRESGVQVIYNPEALAYQYYEKDFSALAHDETSKGRTAILFSRKHPGAYPETKLAAAYRESPAWRLGRLGLVELSRILPATSKWVARLVQYCEKRRWNRLDMVYRFALDYFFWLGVRDGEDHPVLHG